MNNLDTAKNLLQKMKDPRFYIEKFCKITTNKPGLHPFILNEAQKDFFNTLRKHRRIIILKARQLGFSSATTAYLYHKTIMTPGTHTGIIGYDANLTKELLNKIKIFMRNTPESIRPTVEYNSKDEISFPALESKITVLASTDTVGRGYTFNNLLLTELAFWDKASDKLAALQATVPKEGHIVIESCVSGDTIVLTEKGPIRMKNIHDWDNNPMGFSRGKKLLIDGHYGLNKIAMYYNSGIRKGYELVTSTGNKLKMSSVHKLFVLNKDSLELEFKEAKDIKPGDYVPVKIGQELWGDNDKVIFSPTPYGFNKGFIKLFNIDSITPSLAYLIGLIIGDGYVDFSKGKVVITNIDKEVVSFLKENDLGLKFFTNDDMHYVCTNASFVEFLSKVIGLKKVKAPMKEVPEIVLGWSRENVKAFLSGLFDSDGCCDVRGRVLLYSTSEKIVDTVKVLLQNFGIVSVKRGNIVKPTKKVKVSSFVYCLETNEYNAKIFCDKIGFRIKRKQSNHKDNVVGRFFIPFVGNYIKKHKEELGLTINSGFSNKCLHSKNDRCSYETIEKILNQCTNKYSYSYTKLKTLYSYQYHYESVVSMNDIEENVYDVNVPGGNTVTYNGIVGHQTPNGVGNLYHRIWMGEDNGWEKKEYGWWWKYTEEEIEMIRKQMNDPLKFAQEYELAFLTSGRNVFDMDIVTQMREFILKVGMVHKDREGNDQIVKENEGLIEYCQPTIDGMYCIGADPSEGIIGGDYCSASIWNKRTGEQVAFFKGLVDPHKFGALLDKWGRKYNNALLAVEINNHGIATVGVLKNLLYPNMYFRPTKFEQIGMGYSDKIGWRTTGVTRPLLIDDFGQAIRDGSLLIHSKELLDEMLTFIYDKSNNANAQDGYHDDAIFAAAIGIQAFKIMYCGTLKQINYQNYIPDYEY